MKFKYLGTAAAEVVPALWCTCDTCRKCRQNGGKDIRRRASYLIDDDTMVDFGPDANWQVREFGIDLSAIKRLLITHPHEDHLDPVELMWRRPGFSVVENTVKVFGSHAVACTIMETVSRCFNSYDMKSLKIDFHPLGHGSDVTDDDMRIVALTANHAPGRGALFYAVSRGGKTVLIGNDTGIPSEAVWSILETMKFDMVSLDCTMAFAEPDCANGHMGVNAVLKFADRLRNAGCLNPGCRVIATHFSHNGRPLQSDLEAFFAPHQIEVAYDGMTVEI